MTTAIIPSGHSAATSADITVAAGTPVAIHGSGVGAWTAQVQIKNSDGSYTGIGGITALNPLTVLSAPATYRVSRPATDASITALIDQD